ncbi:MAG TPA: carboxylating nicotinate-nucleotide diphosphorylase [Vicinamibacterales bacterium]|nr:carboxylating nicotinate-nucleotide diphosphorylase [Vicinamibacterales bacterium]
MKVMSFEPLDAGLYREPVRRALAEDFGWGDITTESTVPRDVRATAVIIAKADCVIAGIDVACEAFRQLDPGVVATVHHADGQRVQAGSEIATLNGQAAALLTAERTALNFLQRLSGIATLTRKFVDAAAGRIVVLDTRKTTPLLRVLEKYAVRAGGGRNHRFGLDDAVLIKDNHIRVAGGIAAAVAAVRKKVRDMPIEVEAQSLAQVDDALGAGADVILLDNLATQDIVTAVARCRGRAKTEISGGVTLPRMTELAATGADYVSVGALTHSAPAIDLSVEIELSGILRRAEL